MICYRDMTFCASDCVNTDCRRHFGPEEERGRKNEQGIPAPQHHHRNGNEATARAHVLGEGSRVSQSQVRSGDARQRPPEERRPQAHEADPHARRVRSVGLLAHRPQLETPLGAEEEVPEGGRERIRKVRRRRLGEEGRADPRDAREARQRKGRQRGERERGSRDAEARLIDRTGQA